MRIAIRAPPVEPVPPPLYGGTERVVSLLTEELVLRGHEVTLFASGDSRTAATLVPVCPRGLRRDMVGLAAAGQATGSAWWAPMPAGTVDPAAFQLVPRRSVRVAARLAHGDTSLSRS